MEAAQPLLPHKTAQIGYCATCETRRDELLLDLESYDVCEPSASSSKALHSIGALWRAGHKGDAEISAASAPVAEFYRQQNELLQGFRAAVVHLPRLEESDKQFLAALGEREAHENDGPEGLPLPATNGAHETVVRRAVVASNIANAFLLVAQIFAFTMSGSLAVLACFLDAVLDFVSGLLIFFTWSLRKRRDLHRYPVGRERLEPLGSLGMACLMTAATLVTLQESVSALVGGESAVRFVGISRLVAGVIVTALMTKLALYVYCGRVKDVAVQSLREDHRNDVLSNATSLVTVFAAQFLFWWLDPMGAIVISCLIIRNWVCHTLEHCDQLLGKVADKRAQQIICFTALNHNAELKFVDTVRAYHVGPGIFAEVDIVLNRTMPLHRAHDIGEDLQNRIEQLEGVERCFVHLDTETDHSPSIEHKQL